MNERDHISMTFEHEENWLTVHPDEAGRRLADMKAAYDAQQRTDSATRTAEAERAGRAERERQRLSPDEAAAKLNEKMASAEWRAKMLTGNAEARRELAELVADKTGGSLTDSIMNGDALKNGSNLGFVTHGGQIPLADQVAVVDDLRIAGVRDDAIRDLLEGRQVTPAEYDAVRRFREARLSDPEWTKKMLAGDPEAKRELLLMSMVRVSGSRSAA
jgi:hypothetical protein